MLRKIIYMGGTAILLISLSTVGLFGCKGTTTTLPPVTVTNTATQLVTTTNTATATSTKTVIATTTATTTSTATSTAVTTAPAVTIVTTAMMSFDPIVVNVTTGEVSFIATVKATQHAAGANPQQLSRPPILVCENQGSALPSAALQAVPGVTGEKLTNALIQLGLKPGQNTNVGDQNVIATGDAVKIYIEINGLRTSLDDLLKGAYPAAQTNFVFDGAYKTQWTIGCGCLICGGSGPGTILANASYSTSAQALIGPTLHAGLFMAGCKDGDQVKVVIKKG